MNVKASSTSARYPKSLSNDLSTPPSLPPSPIQQQSLANRPSRLLMPTVRSQRSVHHQPAGFAPSSPPPRPAASTTQLPSPPSPVSPRPHKAKPGPARLRRHRSGSQTNPSVSGDSGASQPQLVPIPPAAADVGARWLGVPLKFEVVEESLEVEGYQMYAVEKWIVERHRAVISVMVYTGNPSHKITVTALSPDSLLPPADAQAEWAKALHHLRRDGARPMEIAQGVLMVTSLAHFRSDFTIVHIPTGNYLHAQQQLYTNINLLRMGCSARSALVLDEPSNATKERFITMYQFPDSILSATAGSKHSSLSLLPGNTRPTHQRFHSASLSLTPEEFDSYKTNAAIQRARSRPPSPDPEKPSGLPATDTPLGLSLFNATVLELVKLIQACLSSFGLYNMRFENGEELIDGLLCDVTVDGFQHWVTDIGEPCVGVEPVQRVADPMAVSALLSMMLTVRNKLAALGWSHVVPKDPFLHPGKFKAALASYLQSTSLSPPSVHNAAPPSAVLTRALVESINAAYDKSRLNEGRKVRRVILNKLDDLTSAVAGGDRHQSDKDGAEGTRSGGGLGRYRLGIEDEGREGRGQGAGGLLLSGLGIGGGGAGGPAAVLESTMDLEDFVRAVVGGRVRGQQQHQGKGEAVVGASARSLWGGRVADVERLREWEREKLFSFGKRDKKTAKVDLHSEGDRESGGAATDGGKSTEDEGDAFGLGLGRPWSERVQKKLGSWTGLNRSKKGLDGTPPSLTRSVGKIAAVALSNESSSSSQRPVVAPILSEDPEETEPLSSGQASPVEGSKPNILSSLHPSPGSSRPNILSDVSISTSDHDKLVDAFNKRRPPLPGKFAQSRVISWSDPMSFKDLDDEDLGRAKGRGARPANRSQLGQTSPVTLNEDAFTESPTELSEEVKHKRRLCLSSGGKRRHSFHAMSFHEGTRILSAERMRIDVELCGQLLIMWRREQYLGDALFCLQSLITSLADTNASLREQYTSHLAELVAVEARTKALAQTEEARVEAERIVQETNTLLYESEQFHVSELRRMASAPRQKVLDMREQVFGTGGRRLRRGVHGAHGRFNRLQRTLDGGTRLVDHLGRTESEAEEEQALGAESDVEPSGDEEDVVVHAGMKPVWLLRFFTRWTTWGGHVPSKKGEEGQSKDVLPDESTEAERPGPPPAGQPV